MHSLITSAEQFRTFSRLSLLVIKEITGLLEGLEDVHVVLLLAKKLIECDHWQLLAVLLQNEYC